MDRGEKITNRIKSLWTYVHYIKCDNWIWGYSLFEWFTSCHKYISRKTEIQKEELNHPKGFSKEDKGRTYDFPDQKLNPRLLPLPPVPKTRNLYSHEWIKERWKLHWPQVIGSLGDKIGYSTWSSEGEQSYPLHVFVSLSLTSSYSHVDHRKIYRNFGRRSKIKWREELKVSMYDDDRLGKLLSGHSQVDQ